MATKEQIMKAILDVAGNPDTGVVREYAERWADAVVGLDAEVSVDTQSERSAKETRVTKPGETR